MITTGFDSRVQIQQVIQNHLPEFVKEEFPKVSEFLKQYYISQEYQSGPTDIAENIDQYIKLDNLTPEVINGTTKLSYDINSSVGIITVSSTKGYPDKYGLLKIDDEIITYTGITTNTFTGCIRGFSGITGYNLENSSGELAFSTSESKNHVKNSEVKNLSVLFLKEFYKKLKFSLTPGLESTEFYPEINVNTFIKSARTFYQTKGSPESVRILFRVLYGKDVSVVDLENFLIKPSSARFNRVKVISAELISGSNPLKLVGQVIRKSTDFNTQASVSSIEIFTQKLKTYYKISLFIGYDENSSIEGNFSIPGKTKVIGDVNPEAEVITVDSTIGFPNSGSVLCNGNIITYSDKTINQFLNCSGVENFIDSGSDLRFDEVIYGYEDGDIEKKVEFRITGSLSNLEFENKTILSAKDDIITIKNIGESILDPESNKTRKEIFANSFLYNISVSYEVSNIVGSSFYLKTLISTSGLRVGDVVDIVSTKTKNVVFSDATISSISPTKNQLNLSNISGFSPDSNQTYALRRKLKKAYSNTLNIEFGNYSIISDIQNLYVDDKNFGYIASNSLPSYEIKSKILSSKIERGYNTPNEEFLQGYIQIEDKYSIISFNAPVEFITGDRIVYTPENYELEGLDKNESYYVEVLDSSNKIRLYLSRSFIGSDNYVKFKKNEDSGYHRFILFKDRSEKIGPQKILRKFPLVPNIFTKDQIKTDPGTTSVLRNGVEILNYKSEDKLFYGPLSSIQILNGGKNFDVVNPPKLTIDSPLVSYGTTALAVPVITGTVSDVLVDPQDYDIDKVLSLTISGGNGKGAILYPFLDAKFRELSFDARSIYDGGGLDIENEAIAFDTQHNFKDGEEIYYSNNGNPSIGIGTFEASNTNQDRFLGNGSRYFAKIINPKSIKIYPDLVSFNLGINTVGFTTINNGGIHKFRTKSRNVLKSVKVINPGSGFSNRQLYVKSSGINTYFNLVEYENHNFENGDIVEYVPTGQSIVGISTLNSYFVLKVDENSFKLSDAGIGATITENYQKKKTILLSSTGSGYHIFKYPDIKVDIKVSYADTAFSSEKINLVPVVKGSISDVYLYEKGSGYGSKILNIQKSPGIKIENGQGAEVRPVIKDGRIIKVNVLFYGQNYYSVPDLIISGDGTGCVLRAVVENKKLKKVIVINSGSGYTENKTSIVVSSSGTGSILKPLVRSLTLNNQKRFGSNILVEKNDNLQYCALSYDIDLYSEFNENVEKHSEIIGWAYDGNPIYGPFGFSDPNDISSTIKRVESGYELNDGNIEDRPSGFELGFFVEDYKFINSGDLDIYNGRYGKTPEFPNGIYAYFATIVPDVLTSDFVGKYPYFIGDFYRSNPLIENKSLDQYFDFNNSKLSRNTYPYKVSDPYAGSEFLVESNENIKQLTKIEGISKGFIEDLEILNSGKDYRVNDICIFKDSTDSGGGLGAYISEINGIDITKIETTAETYNNVVFEWRNDKVVASYSSYHTLSNNDFVTISGLTTSIPGLKKFNRVGVTTENITLLSSMNLNITPGYVEDIVISPIPPYLIPDTLIKIEAETLKVLNVFPDQSIIRVRRADVGLAHTAPLSVTFLPNQFFITTRVDYFNSEINKKVYFNPVESVGIGTTPGVGVDRNYVVGGVSKSISVPTQSIYIPNHPFKDRQKVILRKKTGMPSLVASMTSGGPSFNVPFSSDDQTLFVINKSKDYIGLTTELNLINTTNGLFILEPIPNNYEYSLESNFNQIKGTVSKIKSKVSVSTDHNLLSGDRITLNLVPNTSVGIGTSGVVRVLYEEKFKKLLIDTEYFNSSQVNLGQNKITINNHQFKTGDKIYYDSDDSIITGLSTGEYFTYKLDDNSIQIAETYYDLFLNPPNVIKFTSIGGNLQKINLVNPNITVTRGSTLVFDVSDSSLKDYNFKLYSDNTFNKEYVGNPGTISVVGVGTIGVDPLARINLIYNEELPNSLYYAIERNGQVIGPSDNVNELKISFTDSVYNNTFNIFGIGRTSFNITLQEYPERYEYSQSECNVLNYSTNSANTKGPISKIKITNSGYNYDVLPELSTIITDEGKNALIVPKSSNIGSIDKYRIISQGFDYFSDKTLRPEAYIYPVVFLKDSNTIESVDILNGGSNYSSSPNLLIKNTETKEIVDFNSLSCETPFGSVSKVNIDANIYGLSSAEHEIVCIDNSNGVGITSIITSSSGIATCILVTPLINGFSSPPFSVGDEIFVENIVNELDSEGNVIGSGYNSENYNYEFFIVSSYENTNPAILEFNVSGFSTNPGIAKGFQSGYASIVNKKIYPKFKLNQNFARFEKGESLLVYISNQFFEVDLFVEESNKDYIKVSGYYIYELRENVKLKGKKSGIIATVSSIYLNKSKFNIDYSTDYSQGWKNDTGKLSENYQVIQDNDYYQNLSYTIKGPIEFEKFIDPVNRLVHVSGLKNFGDLQVESKQKIVSYASTYNDQVILDVFSENRVDIVNNYLFASDYDTITNNNTVKSKFLKVNKSLTDYILCLSNRVLPIDNISNKFANKETDRDLFTNLYTFIESDVYSKYLIQVIDPNNKKYSLTELVVFIINDNVYTFERSNLSNSSQKLGDFSAVVDDFEVKRLRFIPSDPYEIDYDIKVIQSYFDSLTPAPNIGINTLRIGCIDLMGKSVEVGIGSTATVFKIPKNEIKGFVADLYVLDTVRFNVNVVEVIVDHDGQDTFLSEYYIDNFEGASNNYFATFESKIQSNDLYLNVYNNSGTKIVVNGRIIGFGKTESGIGTSRFLIPGQPAGAERSARYQSNYTISSGVSTVFSINKNLDSTFKSVVRVSYGNTTSIHQVLGLQDEENIYVEQFPFLSVGISSGIGTFGGEFNGEKCILKFYPDPEITGNVLIQSYNEVFYKFSDYENESLALEGSNVIRFDNIEEKVILGAYDAVNGPRANKLDFDAKYDGYPIYKKTFDPNLSIDYENNTISIKNHFFNTAEKLIYRPESTFIGVGISAIGIVTSLNSVGVSTDKLPSDVYAIRVSEDVIKIATTKQNALSGFGVTFVSPGEGNAHELEMTKKLEKTVLSIDGIVQKPLSYTGLKYKVKNDVGTSSTYFSLSGISTIQPTDLLKVDDEYMLILSVGVGTTSVGPITPGIGTLPIINVKRGFAGTISSIHYDNTDAVIYRGSFNIAGSKIYFTQPPRGSARDIRDLSNLPYPKSTFAGRVFLRQDYTTNTLYDDISSQFTGVDQQYTLTVQGINTTGIETGSGIVFINGVFQTPSTENNQNNNYKLEGNTGITSVVFTGLTSTNGDIVNSVFDINQNGLPRGGLIVSLGSTQGLGFAPLVGASVTAVLNPSGSIISVGLGSTDVIGSGYNGLISIGVTDPNHTGSAATITATVGAGGTLAFNVLYGGTGYVNPKIITPDPSYSNLEIIGVSRRGIGNTSETGKNMIISVEVGPNSRQLPGKNADAANLIDSNKQLIAEVAVGRMLDDPTVGIPGGFGGIPGGNQNCIDDVIDILESITYNLRYSGNDKVYDAAKIYVDNPGLLLSEKPQSIYVYEQVKSLAIQAMRNETISIGGYSSLSQYKDNTIIGDISGVPGVYGPTDCSDIESAITSFVGIVTNAIQSSTLPTKTIAEGSLFEVKSFKIERPGYGFQLGDIFKPVGLVTAKGLLAPISDFELTVTDVFTDSFSAWQFGELDYIDSIKNLQDGVRKRFPLYYKGQLLSFEKDDTNTQYPILDLNQVLLIFVNGVIQQPGEAYQFNGGSSFLFTEAPTPDAKIAVFFYRGSRDIDSFYVDINETLKIGDSVRVRKLNNNPLTVEQEERRIEDFSGSDLVQTNIYVGLGINEEIERPLDWIKQKRDIIINGDYVYKTRDSLEGQVYPTAKIIKDVSVDSQEIFVDDAEFFSYEEKEYGIIINKFNSLIVYNTDPVAASITAIVDNDGKISSLDVVNPGLGYTYGTVDVKIAPPRQIGVGIGTTAIAVATIVNGQISSPIVISNPGLGYDKYNPPQVITALPNIFAENVKFERETQLVPISRGFSGIVTGIGTTSGTSGNPLAIKFYLRRFPSSETFDDLLLGYPIYVFNTSVGSGLTSIDQSNSMVVGVGTEFVNNIYYVHSINRFGPEAIVTCNIHSNSNISGIDTSSNYLNPIGNFSWGILSKLQGISIGIGVSGLTVDSGLSTYPTIQRRGFGLRDNGSVRKLFI